MNVDNDPRISPAADQLTRFRKDDLEFRTITTILSKLNACDDREERKIVLAPSIAKHMKQLASVSTMLVTNHEVIAIMPKRSTAGLTLFIVLQPNPPAETKHPEDQGESTSVQFITKNPREEDHPPKSVTFMDITDVEIGTDIFKYITDNWKQSFEQHAQATAKLIAACQSGGKSEWLRLAHYAIFQSAAKVLRRFGSSRSFRILNTLPPPSEEPVDFPGFSRTDKIRLRGMLLKDDDLAEHFPLLDAFVDPTWSFPNATSSLPLINEFHGYFVWLLRESMLKVQCLDSIRSSDGGPPPAADLGREIEWAHGILEDLHYFVWRSNFFDWYILKYRRLSISDLHSTDSSGDDEGDTQGGSQASEDSNPDQNDEREEGDFPTEFEVAANHEDSAAPEQEKGPADQIYSWLRLVTSTIQHATCFRRTTPGPRIKLDFQVITYPVSDKMMKPWMETITELGGGETRQIEILDILSKNSQFASFITRKRLMKFTGRAHCEAVLGCLHSLAKRGENLTWAGVPQGVMDILKTSYSIVAPSKRCCPVCSTLIASLSRENGGPILNTLAKHPFIYPTALPVGLPESIRRRLLDQYRERLRQLLDTLVANARKSSSLSLQSQPLSVGCDEGDEATVQEDESSLQDSSRLWLVRWFEVPDPDRRKKWQKLQERAPDMWECCRCLMRAEGGGLYRKMKVPDYVLAGEVQRGEGEEGTQ